LYTSTQDVGKRGVFFSVCHCLRFLQGGILLCGIAWVTAMQSNLVDKAKEIMEKREGHCAQAIFAPFGEYLSEGKVDFDTCMKISSAFSGGVAHTGNICGALNGALMSLGLKYGGSDSTKVNEVARELLDEFVKIHGSIICRELINHDLLTDGDVKKAFENGAFKNCSKFVEDVAILLEKRI
jgi:C_GCAxxG_C_C family probable redox protein